MRAILTLSILGLLLLSTAVVKTQQSCQPDQNRRLAAIRIVREINTKLAAAYQATRRYPVPDPSSVPNGEGLLVSGLSDGSRYVVTVRDGTAACALVWFSDQSGLIYEGGALQ